MGQNAGITFCPMKRLIILILISILTLSACTPPTQVVIPQLSVVQIQYTAAAQPWLADFYVCADLWPDIELKVEQRVASFLDFGSADLILRVGSVGNLVGDAYAIGREAIFVAVNQNSLLQEMDAAQVRLMFVGQSDPTYQMWAFDSGDDVQQVFAEYVMNGAVISSNARLATSLQEVFDALESDSNAVGVLPSHWLTGNTRQIFAIPEVPVLAIIPERSTETLRNILGCVQEKNGNLAP